MLQVNKNAEKSVENLQVKKKINKSKKRLIKM